MANPNLSSRCIDSQINCITLSRCCSGRSTLVPIFHFSNNVAVTTLLESCLPCSLRAITHIPVRVHQQPIFHSHAPTGKMNQQTINDIIFYFPSASSGPIKKPTKIIIIIIIIPSHIELVPLMWVTRH